MAAKWARTSKVERSYGGQTSLHLAPALLGALLVQPGDPADLGTGSTGGAGELHLLGDALCELAQLTGHQLQVKQRDV